MSRTDAEESPRPDRRVRLLIVAGRDPSGAGLDADLAAAREPWIEAIPIVTAETDQDATRVRSIGARDPRAWLGEALEAGGMRARDHEAPTSFPFRQPGKGRTSDGLRTSSPVGPTIEAIKFGLLPGGDHVRAARDLVRELRRLSGREIPVVVDPVIAASSGGRFLDWPGVEAVGRDLAPYGVVLTPNLAEAAELAALPLQRLITVPDSRLEAARKLLDLCAAGVVIKGGHGVEHPALDLVMRADGSVRWLSHTRIPGTIRGSGCRFATRLAAGLGRGATLETAAEEAGRYVASAIARVAERVFGSGAGPR
jgi:hydroxymethylpyrimidine kinase/phosphomethylpyrimidine kinase